MIAFSDPVATEASMRRVGRLVWASSFAVIGLISPAMADAIEIPEPVSISLFAVGLASMAIVRARRAHKG